MWRYGAGASPYLTYNGLDADYRPIGEPEVEPRPPRNPWRLRAFLYACGQFAAEEEMLKFKSLRGGM